VGHNIRLSVPSSSYFPFLGLARLAYHATDVFVFSYRPVNNGETFGVVRQSSFLFRNFLVTKRPTQLTEIDKLRKCTTSDRGQTTIYGGTSRRGDQFHTPYTILNNYSASRGITKGAHHLISSARSLCKLLYNNMNPIMFSWFNLILAVALTLDIDLCSQNQTLGRNTPHAR